MERTAVIGTDNEEPIRRCWHDVAADAKGGATPRADLNLPWVAPLHLLARPELAHSLRGLPHGVGCCVPADPQSYRDRRCAEALRLLPSYQFQRTDQRGRSLELLDGEQAKRVAHQRRRPG